MTSTVNIQSQFDGTSNVSSHLRLRDILRTLPKDVFVKNRFKAWSSLAINTSVVALAYWGIAVSPWYLLPILWVILGTALTGFFVIAHDCGHRSFANRRWVNDLVGHIVMLPVIYPYHAWRILHNHHHKHTNKMEEDNAWQPFQVEFYDSLGSLGQFGYRLLRGRFWWVGSIVHWGSLHFNWGKFEGKQRQQIRFSALLVLGFSALFFPTLIATTGFWGFVKFWLCPWIVYHFWMSTFTLVHHTASDIPFKFPGQWNEAMAQLAGTVHCQYPWWVEFLCHDINVHIPHHLSTAIPSYNLRRAHELLKENWGEYMHETRFSWELMQEITDECHLYNPKTSCYQSFADYQAQK